MTRPEAPKREIDTDQLCRDIAYLAVHDQQAYMHVLTDAAKSGWIALDTANARAARSRNAVSAALALMSGQRLGDALRRSLERQLEQALEEGADLCKVELDFLARASRTIKKQKDERAKGERTAKRLRKLGRSRRAG